MVGVMRDVVRERVEGQDGRGFDNVDIYKQRQSFRFCFEKGICQKVMSKSVMLFDLCFKKINLFGGKWFLGNRVRNRMIFQEVFIMIYVSGSYSNFVYYKGKCVYGLDLECKRGVIKCYFF